MTLYDQMTPAQQAEIDRQEDEREARKAGYDYVPTEQDLADMAEAFGWNEPMTDDDLDAMAREHDEEMAARAEMESAALLKYTGGQWA